MKCQHGSMSKHNMEIDWKHQTWVSIRDSDHCWNLPTGPEAIKTRSKRAKLFSFGRDWSWLVTLPDCMTLWIETIEANPRLCLIPTNAHGFEPITRFWSDGWTSISNGFFWEVPGCQSHGNVRSSTGDRDDLGPAQWDSVRVSGLWKTTLDEGHGVVPSWFQR